MINSFQIVRPGTLADAVTAMSGGDDIKALAGGQTMIPTLKQRLAAPERLVDLSQVNELKGIEVTAEAVTIGAMTTHADVAANADVAAAIPALAALAGGIGDPQVRNAGTLGGSVANNDPAADYPGAVLGLGATVHTSSRTLSAEDFFQGMFTTALAEDELITKISFPRPTKAVYMKFDQPASRYALTGVFLAVFGDSVRLAVTGAGSEGVFRVPAMEAALAGSFTTAALDGLSVDPDEMLTDIHGTGAYRAHLVGVLAKRAVMALS